MFAFMKGSGRDAFMKGNKRNESVPLFHFLLYLHVKMKKDVGPTNFKETHFFI